MERKGVRLLGRKNRPCNMTTKNYAEFYSLLGKLPGATDGLKEDLVKQFTAGRTSSLKEMMEHEYRAMCASMRGRTAGMEESTFTVEIKRRRSAVLKRMQRLGIDTTVWANVDNFCMNPRIMGKRFARLSIEELSALIPKLESMIRKRESKRMGAPDELINVSSVNWN